MNVVLSRPQSQIFTSPCKYVACAAGLGSGKTFTIALRLLDTYFKYKGCNLAYSAPTYGLIRDIIYPLLEDFLIGSGIKYSLNKTDSLLSVPGYGNVFFRSMTKPETIVGFSILDCFLDELDVIPQAQAEIVVDKFIGRMRQKSGKKNQMYLISSPEGFKYMYHNFEKAPLKDSTLIRMSTYSNAANLPDDYIDTMRSKYPQSMIEAYLMGLFVNIAASRAWKDFDRRLNASDEVEKPGEPLHVGMDFNVDKGCAVVHVLREEKQNIHAVGEVHSSVDTPATINTLKENYPNHPIIVYPDATGKSRKSLDATNSDIALLKKAGFSVKHNPKNPAIKERVMATNAMFCNGFGERRYYINVNRCPVYTDALEHQATGTDGLPVKDGKMDNITDAGTYPIVKLFPIKGFRAFSDELEEA
jgi:PBSX family phage terminase large subunit